MVEVARREVGAHAASSENLRVALGEVDRLTVLWRAKYVIVAAAVVAGLVVYGVSSLVPPVYSSSSIVSVTAAATPGGSAEDEAGASNELAAQDAQVVTTYNVLSLVSGKLGHSASFFASHLSSGTIGAQNLIQITAQSRDPAAAARWAAAAAEALQTFLNSAAAANAKRLGQELASETSGLNSEIASIQAMIAANPGPKPGSAAYTELEAYESQVTSLTVTRATLTANIALAVASQTPVVEVLQSSSSPTKLSPEPRLYAGVAVLVAMLVAAEASIAVSRRRQWSYRAVSEWRLSK